jgi:hypothetical protein
VWELRSACSQKSHKKANFVDSLIHGKESVHGLEIAAQPFEPDITGSI